MKIGNEILNNEEISLIIQALLKYRFIWRKSKKRKKFYFTNSEFHQIDLYHRGICDDIISKLMKEYGRKNEEEKIP